MRVGGAAAAPALAVAARHGRKAQGNNNGCGRFQCYVEKYNLCLHKMSNECISQRPDPEVFITSTVTPPPTPMQVTQSIQIIETDIQIIETESPILVRLLNVAEDYTLSSLDRTRYVSMIQGVLDDALGDPWEGIRVEYTCEYVGERRLQSSPSIRRLNKTLYLPVLVTLRGEESWSDMAQTFSLQAIRNKLNILSMNLKSLNPNAFRNLQLSVEELNLDDVACASGPTASIQSIITVTNTDKAAPIWVWMIVAAICIPLGFCLLICTFRSCKFKRRKRVTMDDYLIPNQLAAFHGYDYANSYGNGVRYDKRRQNDVIYSRSEGTGRHGRRRSRRRRGDERRRHGAKKSRDYRKRTHNGQYISNRDVDMNRQSDHRLAIKSLSTMAKEIEQAQMNMPDERALVALPAHQSALVIDNPSQDLRLALEYQENALVVYDDEQIRFTLEPEGLKIEDVKPETAVALYMPPNKSKGAPGPAAVDSFNPPKEETEVAPRKKSRSSILMNRTGAQ
eukprot:scaffold159_cov151-Skeletonema_menzelii.AAC.19